MLDLGQETPEGGPCGGGAGRCAGTVGKACERIPRLL